MIIATQKFTGGRQAADYKAMLYLILPWALIAIFGGMGPPPETPAAWAALAAEQRSRYVILIISGIAVTIGFFHIHKLLSQTGGAKYALFGKIMMLIALPLFIGNMAYWGFFLTDVFVKYSQPTHPAKPLWLKTLSDVFTYVRMIEVALIYLATAVIAIALLTSKLISKPGAACYIAFACLGALFNLLPQNSSGPLSIPAYLSIIPAFTLLMPYLIGVNLIYKLSSQPE
ncbi:MAG: hypothetical protein JKY70_15345 [Mucilaginibacter sp.]|nr:hypothetical protein [Mucilaginibacter sp.]